MFRKIKAILLLLITVYFCNIYVFAEETSLRLELKVLGIQHCLDGESHSYRIGLEIKYTNAGAENIILDRGSDKISYLMIARNETDLTAKRYETSYSSTTVTSGSRPYEAGSTPDASFIILKPGKTYRTWAKEYVIVKTPLALGEHLLQVIIPTWNDTEKKYEVLKEKWKKTGKLWGRGTFSVPATLIIQDTKKVKRC